MPAHRTKGTKKKAPPKTKTKSLEEAQAKGYIEKEWIFRTIDLMKRGNSTTQIKETIMKNKPGKNTPGSISQIITEANRILSQEFAINRKYIEGLHVKRYNVSINKLLAVKETDFEDIAEGRKMQIIAYSQALDTMYQKEKLLQFHSKNFKIEINNQTNININDGSTKKKKGPAIDIMLLTFEEQVELYHLMEQSRHEEVYVEEHTEVIEEQEEITEDAEAVVVEDNINKIKTITRGIDDAPPAYVTVDDPVSKLKESLRKKAAQVFQKSNANLDKDEMQQLPKGKANRK